MNFAGSIQAFASSAFAFVLQHFLFRITQGQMRLVHCLHISLELFRLDRFLAGRIPATTPTASKPRRKTLSDSAKILP
jgi:hypothetical protein